MKKLSVKVRITLWITVMMALLSGLLLVFMLSISSGVTSQTAMGQLSQVVQSNLEQVDLTGGTLVLGEDFTFYHGGVYTLVYSQSETLLAGQLPVSFTSVSEPFQNGSSRTVAVDDGVYLVLDLWAASGWDSGVWLRGIMELPEQYQPARNRLRVAELALPLFILLAALGSYLIIRYSFRPLDNIAATVSAINGTSDLTGRIPMPRNQDEFSRLTETFNGMFERLEQAFDGEKQFIADASHELRTPVSVVKSACEYSEKYDETVEEHRETVAMIHRQAERMARLIAQLLNITRLDHGTEQLSFETYRLGELVTTVCEDPGFDPERLHVDLDPDCTAQVDATLFTRLVQNLVENAFRYGKPDGQVWVTVRAGGKGENLVTVQDDGIGIAPEDQERIWRRFYQVDPSRSGENGSGLGLSMVRQIAQVLGGYMTLESEPGVGSTFTFHLPAGA